RRSWRSLWESAVKCALFCCAGVSILTTLGIMLVLFNECVYNVTGGEAFFQQFPIWKFLTGTSTDYKSPNFGVLPLLLSTLMVAGIAAVVSLPVGLASAVYLSEYASERTRAIIKPSLEILAGIPTIVYGFFALKFITPYVLQPLFGLIGVRVETFNGLSAGLVVGIMIVPMVASLSEDAIRAVPKSLREAGYALGANRFDVSLKIVVPAAFSGIVAAFILAISRAIGETMAVAIAGGSKADMSMNPLKSVMSMTAYIVNVRSGEAPVGTFPYQSLYGVAMSLFLITLTMNILSQWIMRRFREEYQ
ncbi:MAG: phosphate ABC transporter permease subunit PstC, partial [Planctomycetaceae bacterium]|nr:phosphate ABC transporter permease subunit PstC [Planctomycetaceae bacterium]